MENNKLFSEFPPTSTRDWKEKIIGDLKGADYDKKLLWRNADGFHIQPFYRSEDVEKLDMLDVCPGDYPFVRGTKAKANDWMIRQDIKVEDIEAANAKALDIRMKGVDSLGFVFADNYEPGVDEIELLLKNIRADVMELNFSTSHPKQIIHAIDVLAKKYNRDLDKIRGSVDFDSLNFFSLYGKFRNGKDDECKLLEDLIRSSEHLPNFQVLTIDATNFHNSGSGIVSQVAFSLAKGVEYLSNLIENGFDIDQVAPKIRFHFAVGSSYFMEIAKFRAARFLWANIVNAYGLSDARNAAMFIHCSNSAWNKTVYDPYSNMLRTTTETMSSVLGGIDSMSVLPFNAVFEETTEFSERIARNQQLLLKGESYFDKVADPAAGSYYIEELTKRIIDEAWKLFLKTDEKGGYLKAFESGFIQEVINKESSLKDLDIAKRKRVILGTNQYPNVLEHINENKIDTSLSEKNQETLNPYRGSEAFELLRMKTDQFALKNKRPKVWMFTYGNLAMRNARAQFAANFFGCAGFEIVNNAGFKTVEAGIDAAKKAKADIVVICSSDAEYQDNALLIYEALKNNSIIVLAGYPADLIDQLKLKGFENFIHMRSNVLEELKRYQIAIGI